MADEHHALMQRIIDTWNARDEDGFVGCYSDPMLVQGGGADGGMQVSRAQHRDAARTWWKRLLERPEALG